jgi:hypothetical protein
MQTIEFRRTLDDLVAFNEFLSARLGNDLRYKIRGAAVALVFFGSVAWWQYWDSGATGTALVFLVAGVAYAAAWMLWIGQWRQRRCIRKVVTRLYGEALTTSHTVTLTDDGVQESSSEGNTFRAWSGVPEISRTDDHVLVFVGPNSAHVIPVAAFPSKNDADAFFAAAQEKKSRSRGVSSAT